MYVDRRELVTLMTLGARPERLVLGYLRNQRLVEGACAEMESVTVDWEVGARRGEDRKPASTGSRSGPRRAWSPPAAGRAACSAA